jgi:hypothetical protein
MKNQNDFAFRNSGLNAFLFSDVGSELHGSELTMLSIFARLGQDPWTEAARLARLPKAEAIDSVTVSIGAMALGQQAMSKLAAAASRLILLLPEQPPIPAQGIEKVIGLTNLRQWLPLALLCASVAFGLAVNSMSTPASDVCGAAGVLAPFAVHTAGPEFKPSSLN